MGAVYADIELTNRDDLALVRAGAREPTAVRRETVRALADSGATVLVIPESVASRLGLATVGRRLVAIADGTVKECDLVGPVEIRFGNRNSISTAIAMPGDVQVLLGQVQMEEMDLIIDPLKQELIPNPASPDRARLMAVGLRLYGPGRA